MASKDPATRAAACMVRCLVSCCPQPASLPPRTVLALVALRLGDQLPGVLRARDSRRLAALGLVREHVSALFRAFPTREAADRLRDGAALARAGVPARLAPKAVDAWGEEAEARVRRDPYGAIHELGGTSEDAETLADAMDVDLDARVCGHARVALLRAARDGHTALPTAAVLDAAMRRVPAADFERVGRALADAVADGRLALAGTSSEDEVLAVPDVARVEQTLARDVRARARARHLPEGLVSAAALETDDGARLSDDQLAAVDVVCSRALAVLTGGPGTGKSTLVRALVRALGEDRCLLTAPTGRAARNVGGDTVHRASGGRLLRRRPLQETTAADVPDDLLLLVVDEASMLTTELMVGVLSLAPRTCHVLLVGDPDQLPPVGAGDVLRDLLDTRAVPVASLTRDHRCGEGVRALAAAVRRGDARDWEPDAGNGSVVFVRPPAGGTMAQVVRAAHGDVSEIPAADRPTLTKGVAAIVATEDASPRHPAAQVLVSTNANRALVNRALQAAAMPRGVRVESAVDRFLTERAGHPGTLRCAPDGSAVVEFVTAAPGAVDRVDCPVVDAAMSMTRPTGDVVVGDLVMALKNQSKGGGGKGGKGGAACNNGGKGGAACNGDIGVLRSLRPGGERPEVDFPQCGVCEFPRVDDWLTPAYAATVHKFQGSECDEVVLLLDCDASGWDRRMLYTAVTRARKRVVIVGSRENVERVVARAGTRRYTALRRFLAAAR